MMSGRSADSTRSDRTPSLFVIDTARLVIRPWVEDKERTAFVALATDPEIMQYITHGRPWTGEEIDAFFERQRSSLAKHGFCQGALVEWASGSVVGLAGLHPLGTTGDVEAGWWVARDRWGRGYATEAAFALRDFAFRELRLPRLAAIAHPDNAASIRVMEKIGLTFERRATGHELGLRVPDVEVVLYAAANPSACGGSS